MTILAMVALAWMPHKFHASLGEMHLNAETGTFEVVLRLFSDDLERALSKRHKRSVIIDKEAEVEQFTAAYVAQALVLRDGAGKVMAHSWVGMEIEVKHTYVYVEIDTPADLKGATLTNTIFMELSHDQLNTVNLTAGGHKQSMTFQKGAKTRPLQTT